MRGGTGKIELSQVRRHTDPHCRLCYSASVMQNRHCKTRIAVLSLILVAPACRGGGPNGEDGSGETGESPCTGCDGLAYACFACDQWGNCDLAPYTEGCAASENDVNTACQNVFFGSGGPYDQGYAGYDKQILACAYLQEPNSCQNWDPGSSVAYNSGSDIYEIDESLIDGLIADPSPLVDCDSGRFDLQSGGGYALTGASSGELSYVLGLQNGDVPVSINELSLDDMDGVLEAYSQLYYGGETEFSLLITRGTSNITLDYEIVP